MTHQPGFSRAEFADKKKITRREKFLTRMAARKAVEKAKAAVRAFVEPPFHILKNIFRHRKVRDRGLAKNGHQLYPLFGLANVVIGGRTATT